MKANISAWNGEAKYTPKEIDDAEVFEIEGRKFFTHFHTEPGEIGEVLCCYRVTEWTTGACFIKGRNTRSEAVTAAFDLFKKVGAEKIDARLKEYTERFGICNA